MSEDDVENYRLNKKEQKEEFFEGGYKYHYLSDSDQWYDSHHQKTEIAHRTWEERHRWAADSRRDRLHLPSLKKDIISMPVE